MLFLKSYLNIFKWYGPIVRHLLRCTTILFVTTNVTCHQNKKMSTSNNNTSSTQKKPTASSTLPPITTTVPDPSSFHVEPIYQKAQIDLINHTIHILKNTSSPLLPSNSQLQTPPIIQTSVKNNENFESKLANCFQIVSVCGNGAFGSVYKVRHFPSRKIYAAKSIQITQQSIDELKKEYNILHELSSHPNIIKVYDLYELDSKMQKGIIYTMEYVENGDLMRVLSERGMEKQKFSEKFIMFAFLQLCDVLKAIHEKNIIHRDVSNDVIVLILVDVDQIGEYFRKGTSWRLCQGCSCRFWFGEDY